MQSEALSQMAGDKEAQELRILPRSRMLRTGVWLLVAALGALTFSAWLSPNMVFDLANMVFCD